MESNFIGMALPLSLNAACIMLQFIAFLTWRSSCSAAEAR